jgi:hypothetical protein
MKSPQGKIKINDFELDAELFDATLFYLLDENSIEQILLLSDYTRIKINFETFCQIWESGVLISGSGVAFHTQKNFNCLIFTYKFTQRYILLFDWEWEPLKSKFLKEDRIKKLNNILDENT